MTDSEAGSAVMAIRHHEEIPNEDLVDLRKELERAFGTVIVASYKQTIQCSWEWAVPAVVAIYLGKSFLDGLLKELGADTARGLRTALASVFQRAREKNHRLVGHSDIDIMLRETRQAEAEGRESDSGIVTSTGRAVPVLSIELQGFGSPSPRFVFPHHLDERAFLSALQKLPDAISLVKERMRERTRLRQLLGILQETDPTEASRISCEMFHCLNGSELYAYMPDNDTWVDVVAEIRSKLYR